MGEAVRRVLLRPEAASIAAAIVLFVVFSLISPLFATRETFVSILSVAAELGIVGVGVTLLMIGGHFDLSVGAVIGLSSFVVSYFVNDLGAPPAVAFGSAFLVSIGLGAINGLLVVRTGLHSFVITLGTYFVYRGLLVGWTGGFVQVVEIPDILKQIAAGTHLVGFRMSLLWLIVVVVAATLLLLRTRLGNWIQAIGQNKVAARNLGVGVGRTTVLLFMICSACGGLVGMIQVARFESIDALRGQGTELQAIAVTVIGGTLLSGGYGSAIGTAFGALIFGMIQVGLVLVGVPGYYYQALTGLILVLAVLVNTSIGRRIAAHGPLGGLRRGPGAQT
jgi:simple sugar transport system permease protein